MLRDSGFCPTRGIQRCPTWVLLKVIHVQSLAKTPHTIFLEFLEIPRVPRVHTLFSETLTVVCIRRSVAYRQREHHEETTVCNEGKVGHAKTILAGSWGGQ